MDTQDDFFAVQKENSRIKTEIVTEYFAVWASILSRAYQGQIAYIDLFCGPGVFDDGNESTPVLITQRVLENRDQPFCDRLVTVFNDANSTFAQSLETKLSALPKIRRLKTAPQVGNKQVDVAFADYFGSGNLVPSFVFLDPCGYKALSAGLIKVLTQSFGCDAVVFFNTARIYNSVTNPQETKNLDNILSPAIATSVRDAFRTVVTPQQREEALIRGFIQTMKEQGVTYAVPFCFKSLRSNRTSHHLIFLSKHPLAFRKMKEIMAGKSSESSSDGVSCFCYSDRDVNAPQTQFNFDTGKKTLTTLGADVLAHFAGRCITTKQVIEEYDRSFTDSLNNPYTERNFKKALCKLREDGAITSEHPRNKKIRADTCSDELCHTFPARR